MSEAVDAEELIRRLVKVAPPFTAAQQARIAAAIRPALSRLKLQQERAA